MSQFYTLFPSLVHWIEISSFKEVQSEMTKFAYNERRRDPIGDSKSNMNGWQSNPEYYNGDNILAEVIKKEVYNYFSQERILKEGTELKFKGMWININGKGAYNILHIHPKSTLAAVCWIKSPKDCGDITFNSPQMYSGWDEVKSYKEEVCKATNIYPEYLFPPKEGAMIIFPAYLYHQVLPNKSGKDRISVSFNMELSSP